MYRLEQLREKFTRFISIRALGGYYSWRLFMMINYYVSDEINSS